MAQKKEHRTDKLLLIYGSLYLDEGEPWEFAEKQVDECIVNAQEIYPIRRIGLAFDIVATPAQIATGEAGRLAKHLLTYADERFPNLRTRFVGVTDDDAMRPGRDIALLGELSQDAVDNKHIFVYD